MNKLKKSAVIFFYILIVIAFFFSTVIYALLYYLDNTFEITITEILFTLSSPLKGAGMSFIKDTLGYIIPGAFIFICAITVPVIAERIFKRLKIAIVGRLAAFPIRIKAAYIFRGLLALIATAGVIITTKYAFGVLEVNEYIESLSHQTTIYEDRYVKPSTVSINAPERLNNLIFIYVESMETTYASEDEGGKQPVYNYIPRLTELAEANISFSNTDKLGGFHSVTGTDWTYSAIFSTTGGVPFSFPVNRNDMESRENAATGLETLGDILSSHGYVQEFLCGSDAAFSGRKEYFEQHGGYQIFDYYTAIDKGYIPSDYYVNWGYEDKYLYQIAKDELQRLSTEGKPFNLTMLTVDTHFVGGYVCDLCKNTYEEAPANVIACADNQVCNFIEWCKEQDFYKDTVIVVIGDHPRMDDYFVYDIPWYDRTVYNCFINSKAENDAGEYANREFSHMDIFPTTLAALGFEIDGDRLGLGVNLFSGLPTIMEEMGYDELNAEVSHYSEYYIKSFE